MRRVSDLSFLFFFNGEGLKDSKTFEKKINN